MELDENLLFDAFVEEADERDPDWNSGIIILEAGLSALYSLGSSSETKRKNGTIGRAGSSFTKARQHLKDYFSYALKNRVANEIEIVIEDKKLVSITPRWNQQIMDDFEKSVPKHLKGKFKPWYMNAADVKGEPIEYPGEIMLARKISSISSDERELSQKQLSSMSLQDLLAAFAPYVQEPSNPLWDRGMISVKNDEQGIFSGTLVQYYFIDEEAKKNNAESGSYEKDLKVVTPGMISLFEQVQKLGNPEIPWDTIFLEFNSEGLHNITFEYGGGEVSPFSQGDPENVTGAYLCENLHSCLAHNAPDNYKWVWEVLERKKTAEGRTEISGEFYYSLFEDKSNPQAVEPGEYIYMYHVSERLFDEFIAEGTKNWSKIKLEFTRKGSVLYSVMERNWNG